MAHDREQLYAISKFKMERVCAPYRDKVIAVVGKRGSGKTTLMKDIISNVYPRIENGIVFSPTECANGTWGKIFPPTNVYGEFNEEAIKNAKQYQMEKKKETARRFKRQFGRPAANFDELKPYMPCFLIIFEDCFYDNTIKNNKSLRDLLMNGRHFNFFVMLALQYYLDISPGLRNQIDFAIFCKEANGETLRKLHKQAFSAMIERFKDFKRIFDRHTENRGYLILTPTANSNKAEEVVFYYRADPTTNPTIGSKALWAWAARHYLDPFGLGDDDDEEPDENETVMS
uniref:Putative A32 virion packaging ATPase n=1 Tax=Clandestinovirus TaxID=2831644 RepID=A0A8F8KKG5_9VIRU|nr:putative A32 virion packaging ATPase [Clandestinovirus]